MTLRILTVDKAAHSPFFDALFYPFLTKQSHQVIHQQTFPPQRHKSTLPLTHVRPLNKLPLYPSSWRRGAFI
ncbi:MAG: hypothetical protein IPK82_07485 [Polyangiaceae bacterium]|nr:hypothetical protein [Polyangiaceae bacterium]